MMTCFYQASSLWQTVLLIISQLAVISLAASAIVLFKRKCKLTKQFGTGAVFTLNVVLYIVMQLDSRLTVASQGLHLHIPYGVLLAVTLLSLGYGAFPAARHCHRPEGIPCHPFAPRQPERNHRKGSFQGR